MKKLNTAQTKLERAVQREINRHSADYDNNIEGFIKDLQSGGCSSGMVGSLIYYTDTIKFYKRHQREIDAKLQELCQETGETPSTLFKRSNWDDQDPLARDTNNQNLLAWFGFEETARDLAIRAGIDA